MLHHDKDRFVTVSDETETPNTFLGIRLGDQPTGDTTIPVFVLFDGRTNGFQVTSPQVKSLKHLGDGKYGA
jgi:hypothetical protein